MIYRPLQNGKVAIPDYDEGIRLLTELCKQKQEKGENTIRLEGRLTKLKKAAEKTKAIREEANASLKNGGYELVKIPCFTTFDKDNTNFMNGVCGTCKETGKTYYITNKPGERELEGVITEYLKGAGIDNVYFVSTTKDLKCMGGIDCLTQEE